MAIFGELLRKIDSESLRLKIFADMLDLGRGECTLRLIGASDHAEVYEIESEYPVHPKLVVKCPPFRRLGESTNIEKSYLDPFDEGCFSILGEMDALSRIGSCAFVNMAQYAKSIFGIPALIFRKRDTDLRKLVNSNVTAGDAFVRLAVLHMVARGLVRAQEKGVIIHQDMKPENILIDFLSNHYVIDDDFPALAIPRINDFELTNRISGNRLRGFRPYLPAEHFSNDTPRSSASDRYDIYSLAIIACELLSYGFHPIPTEDPRGLHCSNYVPTYNRRYRNEEKWKKWARKPASEKTLPALTDRTLAATLSRALDPDFRSRPYASDMADAFWDAMAREDASRAQRIGVTIKFLEDSGESGSGAEARFAEQAIAILANAPVRPVTEFE